MTDFIVRIELHGKLADYNALHKWMQDQGFKTTITGGDGCVYQLPTATYLIASNRTKVSLRDWLNDNMPLCGSNPRGWILVIESAGCAWNMGPAIRRAA